MMERRLLRGGQVDGWTGGHRYGDRVDRWTGGPWTGGPVDRCSDDDDRRHIISDVPFRILSVAVHPSTRPTVHPSTVH